MTELILVNPSNETILTTIASVPITPRAKTTVCMRYAAMEPHPSTGDLGEWDSDLHTCEDKGVHPLLLVQYSYDPTEGLTGEVKQYLPKNLPPSIAQKLTKISRQQRRPRDLLIDEMQYPARVWNLLKKDFLREAVGDGYSLTTVSLKFNWAGTGLELNNEGLELCLTPHPTDDDMRNDQATLGQWFREIKRFYK